MYTTHTFSIIDKNIILSYNHIQYFGNSHLITVNWMYIVQIPLYKFQYHTCDSKNTPSIHLQSQDDQENAECNIN